MVKKKTFSTTPGHLNMNLLTSTTGNSNDNKILTDTMKTELIRKLKDCIEENIDKNNEIYDMLNLIKKTHNQN